MVLNEWKSLIQTNHKNNHWELMEPPSNRMYPIRTGEIDNYSFGVALSQPKEPTISVKTNHGLHFVVHIAWKPFEIIPFGDTASVDVEYVLYIQRATNHYNEETIFMGSDCEYTIDVEKNETQMEAFRVRVGALAVSSSENIVCSPIASMSDSVTHVAHLPLPRPVGHRRSVYFILKRDFILSCRELGDSCNFEMEIAPDANPCDKEPTFPMMFSSSVAHIWKCNRLDRKVSFDDLKPNTWYWFRTSIFNSTFRMTSDFFAFQTPHDVPCEIASVFTAYSLFDDFKHRLRHIFLKLEWDQLGDNDASENLEYFVMSQEKKGPWKNVYRTRSCTCIISTLVPLEATIYRSKFQIKARNELGFGEPKTVELRFLLPESDILLRKEQTGVVVNHHQSLISRSMQKQLNERTSQLLKDYSIIDPTRKVDLKKSIKKKLKNPNLFAIDIPQQYHLNTKSSRTIGNKLSSPTPPQNTSPSRSPYKQPLYARGGRVIVKPESSDLHIRLSIPPFSRLRIIHSELLASEKLKDKDISWNFPYTRPGSERMRPPALETTFASLSVHQFDDELNMSPKQDYLLDPTVIKEMLLQVQHSFRISLGELPQDENRGKTPDDIYVEQNLAETEDSIEEVETPAENVLLEENLMEAANSVEEEVIPAENLMLETNLMEAEKSTGQVEIPVDDTIVYIIPDEVALIDLTSFEIGDDSMPFYDQYDHDVAAVDIQRMIRGHMIRQRQYRQSAAIAIQSRFRGAQQNREFKITQQSVIKLQSVVRRKAATKRVTQSRVDQIVRKVVTLLQARIRGRTIRKQLSLNKRTFAKGVNTVKVSQCGYKAARGTYEIMTVAGTAAKYIMSTESGTFILERSVNEKKHMWSLQFIETTGKISSLYVNTVEGGQLRPPRKDWHLGNEGVAPLPVISWDTSDAYVQNMVNRKKDSITIADCGSDEVIGQYYRSGTFADQVPQYVLTRKTGEYALRRAKYGDSKIWLLVGTFSAKFASDDVGGESKDSKVVVQKIYYVNSVYGTSEKPPLNGWGVAQHGKQPVPLIIQHRALVDNEED